ncbi:site-specific DNA-methyltransferase [Mesomycoplasma hyorhinis]|uniref:site-specific DNA-methyltransferase n=1 Tax=Mesomycoplasma hyorhinis TaxID=2100 RepID=UPI00280A8220|nr:site-specific DNA-methyltransferase [Mesomycoplasma hyorhinis]
MWCFKEPYRSREREREREDSNFDLIYIDPPYNTQKTSDDGNNLTDDEITADKFIYRDKFSRTGWLNLLNERLKLAKQLLKEDGVILVSIDNNEHAYLKVLMDEIFDYNFIGNFIWVSNKAGRQIKNFFASTYEHILVYCKNKDKVSLEIKQNMNFLEKIMPYVYEAKTREIFEDEISPYFLDNSLENSGKNNFNIDNRPNLYYPIYTNGTEISIENKEGFTEIFPSKNHLGKQGVWRWEKNKVKAELFNLVVKTTSDNSYKIFPKRREFVYKLKDLIFSSSISTKTGSKDLEKILSNAFDFPKPVSLLKLLISLKPKENTRVLDFFAGSGTTGQAVLELNKEDGGSRSFVLVTNNENNIGQNVTYERLYRINKGQGTKGQKDFEWIKKNEAFDTSLNVFWSKTYNTSLLNNNITNQELKDKFLKLLKVFGINKDKEKFDDSVLKTLSSLRPYKEENEEK